MRRLKRLTPTTSKKTIKKEKAQAAPLTEAPVQSQKTRSQAQMR
jgi:hypothetical protein